VLLASADEFATVKVTELLDMALEWSRRDS
jgi:hypothetical protein